jgi:hypothetical protein
MVRRTVQRINDSDPDARVQIHCENAEIQPERTGLDWPRGVVLDRIAKPTVSRTRRIAPCGRGAVATVDAYRLN